MNRHRIRWILIALALASSVVGGIPADAASTKVVFVLFDLSGSTSAQQVRKRYYEDFKKVLAAIKPGDAIVADGITDNPLAQSTFPINEEFEGYNPLVHNPLIHKKKVSEQKERILKVAEGILLGQKERVKSTKILDSLHLAERIFDTYTRDRKVLVLFSDMVEESEHYNFTRNKLTGRRTDQIIGRERASGRLPDLSGVKVYVSGAGSGGYQGMASDAIFSVEEFWMRYFRACGADLTKTRYGSTLLKFGE